MTSCVSVFSTADCSRLASNAGRMRLSNRQPKTAKSGVNTKRINARGKLIVAIMMREPK